MAVLCHAMTVVATVLELAGVVLIVVGTALLSLPAAVALTGAALLALGYAMERRTPAPHETEEVRR